MSDKVKPWRQRKPKHGEQRGKKIVPLRPGSNDRISPLRIRDEAEAEDYRQWDQRDQEWKDC